MKNLFNQTFMLILIGLTISVTSCKEDDPIIDPGTDGINVADGWYMAKDGEDPASSTGLVSEVVEDEGFASQERAGFVANYMYLDAGSYNMVYVTDKEVTESRGGTVTEKLDLASTCPDDLYDTYDLVESTVDGSAFAIAESGLYKVSFDALSGEIVTHHIGTAALIGSATENGWGADTPLDATINSDGATFTSTGVILRSGEWKVRFNCRWSINRRQDPNAPLTDEANGYQMFTNFGGSTNELVTGGSNIQQTEDGEYTVTVSYSAQDGWSLITDRTGDAPEIAFNPNDYQMAVIGSATAGEWTTDQNLFYKDEGTVHTWYGVVYMTDGLFKFRANDAWDFDLGGDLAALAQGGADLTSPGAGAYYVVLATANDGETWNATVTPNGWGVIGDGSPAMGWDSDVDLTANGFADGVTTYTLTGDFTTAAWKFRAGDAWAHNLGGDLSFLNTDGADITLGAAGTYTVTLSFDGEVYTASVQ